MKLYTIHFADGVLCGSSDPVQVSRRMTYADIRSIAMERSGDAFILVDDNGQVFGGLYIVNVSMKDQIVAAAQQAGVTWM